MKLKTYYQALSAQDKQALAKAIGTSDTYLRHLVEGRRMAGRKFWKKFEVATGGLITRYDLRPDIFES